MSLEQVVQGDDYRASLTALRNFLARQLDECDSKRDAAALTARLADVLERIQAIPGDAEVSAADEVAKRRAARRSGPSGSSRPQRSS